MVLKPSGIPFFGWVNGRVDVDELYCAVFLCKRTHDVISTTLKCTRKRDVGGVSRIAFFCGAREKIAKKIQCSTDFLNLSIQSLDIAF